MSNYPATNPFGNPEITQNRVPPVFQRMTEIVQHENINQETQKRQIKMSNYYPAINPFGNPGITQNRVPSVFQRMTEIIQHENINQETQKSYIKTKNYLQARSDCRRKAKQIQRRKKQRIYLPQVQKMEIEESESSKRRKNSMNMFTPEYLNRIKEMRLREKQQKFQESFKPQKMEIEQNQQNTAQTKLLDISNLNGWKIENKRSNGSRKIYDICFQEIQSKQIQRKNKNIHSMRLSIRGYQMIQSNDNDRYQSEDTRIEFQDNNCYNQSNCQIEFYDQNLRNYLQIEELQDFQCRNRVETFVQIEEPQDFQCRNRVETFVQIEEPQNFQCRSGVKTFVQVEELQDFESRNALRYQRINRNKQLDLEADFEFSQELSLIIEEFEMKCKIFSASKQQIKQQNREETNIEDFNGQFQPSKQIFNQLKHYTQNNNSNIIQNGQNQITSNPTQQKNEPILNTIQPTQNQIIDPNLKRYPQQSMLVPRQQGKPVKIKIYWDQTTNHIFTEECYLNPKTIKYFAIMEKGFFTNQESKNPILDNIASYYLNEKAPKINQQCLEVQNQQFEQDLGFKSKERKVISGVNSKSKSKAFSRVKSKCKQESRRESKSESKFIKFLQSKIFQNDTNELSEIGIMTIFYRHQHELNSILDFIDKMFRFKSQQQQKNLQLIKQKIKMEAPYHQELQNKHTLQAESQEKPSSQTRQTAVPFKPNTSQHQKIEDYDKKNEVLLNHISRSTSKTEHLKKENEQQINLANERQNQLLLNSTNQSFSKSQQLKENKDYKINQSKEDQYLLQYVDRSHMNQLQKKKEIQIDLLASQQQIYSKKTGSKKKKMSKKKQGVKEFRPSQVIRSFKKDFQDFQQRQRRIKQEQQKNEEQFKNNQQFKQPLGSCFTFGFLPDKHSKQDKLSMLRRSSRIFSNSKSKNQAIQIQQQLNHREQNLQNFFPIPDQYKQNLMTWNPPKDKHPQIKENHLQKVTNPSQPRDRPSGYSCVNLFQINGISDQETTNSQCGNSSGLFQASHAKDRISQTNKNPSQKTGNIFQNNSNPSQTSNGIYVQGNRLFHSGYPPSGFGIVTQLQKNITNLTEISKQFAFMEDNLMALTKRDKKLYNFFLSFHDQNMPEHYRQQLEQEENKKDNQNQSFYPERQNEKMALDTTQTKSKKKSKSSKKSIQVIKKQEKSAFKDADQKRKSIRIERTIQIKVGKDQPNTSFETVTASKQEQQTYQSFEALQAEAERQDKKKEKISEITKDLTIEQKKRIFKLQKQKYKVTDCNFPVVIEKVIDHDILGKGMFALVKLARITQFQAGTPYALTRTSSLGFLYPKDAKIVIEESKKLVPKEYSENIAYILINYQVLELIEKVRLQKEGPRVYGPNIFFVNQKKDLDLISKNKQELETRKEEIQKLQQKYFSRLENNQQNI